MSVRAEKHWRNDGGHLARVIPIAAAAAVEPTLPEALAAAAAAEQRIADLEERLAYLEGLSVTDELTRVFNRRGFVLELSRAIAAAQRGGPQGVVIVCDLDGFKAVNDRYGHRAGDDVLRQVAATLARQVRRNDVVGRLGGDEFAVLLIGAGPVGARRKCACFARALIETPPRIDGIGLTLSASFGLAAFDGGEEHETLLHRADMAMYAEKHRPERARALSD